MLVDGQGVPLAAAVDGANVHDQKLLAETLDAIPVEHLRTYETELFRFLDTRESGLLAALAEKKQIDDAIKGELNQALTEFGQAFAAARKTTAA